MLILHVGLGKAGSTTIQRAVHHNRTLLKDAGIVVPPDSYKHHGNFVELADGLRGVGDGLKDLANIVAENPRATIFASSEYLMSVPSEGIEKLQAVVGSHDVTILAYVRPYTEWVPSLYSQSARNGRFRQDFDTFYKRVRRQHMVLSDLRTWANAFGWKNLRVRPIGTASLAGVDLMQDLSSVLDVQISQIDSQNVSPHWMDLEFVRTLYFSEPQPPRLTQMKWSVRQLTKFFASSHVDSNVAPAAYLTAKQRRDLTELYNHDMSEVNHHTGADISLLPEPDLTEREFLPSLRHVPPGIREAFLERCRGPNSPAEDEYIRATLDVLLTREWPL